MNKKLKSFIIVLVLILLISSVVVFAMLGCENPIRQKPILSEMSEEDCVEFIKSRGIVIPDDLNNNELWAFVKSVIASIEKNPEKNFAISYTITLEFVEDIRQAVIDYYEKN